jgi:hypothetical protein
MMSIIMIMMTRSRFISIIAVISKHLITRIRINQIRIRQREKISSRKNLFSSIRDKNRKQRNKDLFEKDQ